MALASVNLALYIAIITGADSYVLTLSGNVQLTMAQPWTLISYAFTHTHFAHLAVNIFLLLWMGFIFERYYSSWLFAGAYIIGGLAGGCTFELCYMIADAWQGQLSGASAAVLAIMSFVAINRRHKSTIEKYIYYILIAIIFINIAGLFGNNPGGSIAHLGGIAAGTIISLIVTMQRRQRTKHADNAKDPLITKAELSGYTSLSHNEREQLFKQSKANSK